MQLQRVHIEWESFDLKGLLRYDCPVDKVYVYDGPDDKSPLVTWYCGANLPEDVFSSR